MQKAIAVIPARYNSTRLPGKPLAYLREKPLIQHVYENVSVSKLIDAVFVATDDKRIFDTVNGFGGRAIMTSPEHTCGTDRITEAVRDIECDIVVNIQGDEPLIHPEMVDNVIELMKDQRVSIGTLAKMTSNAEEIFSPDVVKVVMDNEGFAMYFSRSPIPYYKNEWELDDSRFSPLRVACGDKIQDSRLKTTYCYKHIGIYAYRKDVLLRFSKLPLAKLEKIEKLEQLRALENGFKIKVKETEFETIGVDTPQDLKRVERWLSLYS